MRKNVMTRAWEIYRTLAGDHVAKLAMALKEAWTEAKTQTSEKVFGGKFGTITESNLEKLIEMGANRWQKAGYDRLYLSGAGAKLMGLELYFYKSGNVSSAYLNNEKISNCESHRITGTYSKAYINLETGKVYGVEGKYADTFMKALSAYVIVA